MRTHTVYIKIILLSLILLQPAVSFAQRAKNVDYANLNKELKVQITQCIKDTLKCERNIIDLKEKLSEKDNDIVALRNQLKTLLDSLTNKEVFNKFKTEHQELIAEKDKQTAELKQKSKELDQKQSILAKINERIELLSVYQIEVLKKEYTANKATLKKRLSDISEDEISNILYTANSFSEMEDFPDYLKRIEYVSRNKKLVKECIDALNSSFDEQKTVSLRDDLWKLLDTEVDNAGINPTRMTNEQFSEIDSLDIKLSRFKSGIRKLKELVATVNSNYLVNELRNQKNKEGCLSTIERLIWLDEETINTNKRYFEMIPFLSETLNAWWEELKADPLKKGNKTESFILELND